MIAPYTSRPIMDWIKELPLYLIIPIGVILIVGVIVLVFKAFGEGREISFWPPKIGSKPEPKSISEPIKQSVSSLPQVAPAALIPTPQPLTSESASLPSFAAQGTQETKLDAKKYDAKKRIAEGDYFEFDFPRWDVGEKQTIRIKVLGIKPITVNGQEMNAGHLYVSFSTNAPHLSLQPDKNVEKVNHQQFVLPDNCESPSTSGVHSFWIGSNRIVFFRLHIDNININSRHVDVILTYIF